MIQHIQYILIYILVYKQVVFRRFIFDSISFLTRFLLEVFSAFLKCNIGNADRIACVGVKLFVYFCFILFTGFHSHGRIQFGHPNSSVPKIGILLSIFCILNSLQVLSRKVLFAYFHSHYSSNIKIKNVFYFFEYTLYVYIYPIYI